MNQSLLLDMDVDGSPRRAADEVIDLDQEPTTTEFAVGRRASITGLHARPSRVELKPGARVSDRGDDCPLHLRP